MRTPDDLAAIAATRYQSTWRDALLSGRRGPFSLPLQPPTAAEIITDPTPVDEWLTAWRHHSVTQTAATLRTKTISTRYGEQPVPTHLDLPDLTALADLNTDTRRHWQHVNHRWTRLRPATSDAHALRPWLTQIMALDDHDFDLLLAACDWFRANPASGYTIRQVPVPGMHTKWLARNRRLVLAVLGHAPAAIPDSNTDRADTDPDAAEVPDTELDSLGLRPVPREADILLADPVDRVKFGGLHHIRAPLDELARLPLTPRVALVVENKEAALALADASGLVIVHSLGNHTEVLRHLPWLPRVNTYYWGDLDRHGYTLLSRARTAVRDLRSILMCLPDVTAHQDLGVIETLDRYDPPDNTLTDDETAGLEALTLRDGHLRIEQERIPISETQAAVDAVIAHLPA